MAVERLLARVGLVEHDDLLVGWVDVDAVGRGGLDLDGAVQRRLAVAWRGGDVAGTGRRGERMYGQAEWRLARRLGMSRTTVARLLSLPAPPRRKEGSATGTQRKGAGLDRRLRGGESPSCHRSPDRRQQSGLSGWSGRLPPRCWRRWRVDRPVSSENTLV